MTESFFFIPMVVIGIAWAITAFILLAYIHGGRGER